jgi:hypothetical protein
MPRCACWRDGFVPGLGLEPVPDQMRADRTDIPRVHLGNEFDLN